VSLIVVSGLPPVDGFPALPQPLRWYLGLRAKQFSRDLQRDVEADTNCSFIDLAATRDTSLMAIDGFHPGPGVYALWGQQVADRIGSALGDVSRDMHAMTEGSR
jgi:hypothetical protein